MRVTEKHILFDTGVLTPIHPTKITLDASELEREFGHSAHAEGKLSFCNAEQAIFYVKALIFGDRRSMRLIYEADTYKEVRKYGKNIAGYDKDIWNDRANYAVYYVVDKRFSQDDTFRQTVLESYGDGLSFVYCSQSDKVLANGLQLPNPNSDDEGKWSGRNLYGSAITAAAQIETDTGDDEVGGYCLTPKGFFMMAALDELGEDAIDADKYFYITDLFAKYETNMKACGFVKGVSSPGFWVIAKLLFVDWYRVLRGMGKMTPKDLLFYTASKMKEGQVLTDDELEGIFSRFAKLIKENEYA